MIRSIILFLIIVLVMSCKTDQTKNTAAKVPKTEKVASKFKLQSIPEAEMLRLYNEATYVDYIFYHLPFSLSQDNKPSIHANLKMISSAPLEYLPVTCKAIGREFFHIDGEIVHEADLYFSEGCMGYVFLKDEKPVYGNKLTDEGIKFYKDIIRQSQNISNKGRNGQ